MIFEKQAKIFKETLDLFNFKSGIYILTIKTDKGIFTTKIVKE